MEQSEIRRQNGNLKELIFSLADPAAWELSRGISEKSIAGFIGDDAFERIDTVYLVGHGTSYASALTAELFFSHIAGVKAHCMTAYHFKRCINDYLTDPAHTLVIGYSTGGNTVSVVDSVAEARRLGAVSIGACGEGPSALSAAGSYHLASSVDQDHARPGKEFGGAYTVSHIYAMMASYLLAVRLGRMRGHLSAGDEAYWLRQLDDVISTASGSVERLFDVMSESTPDIMAKRASTAVVIGAGPNIGTVEEAALKISEFTWDFCAAEDLENLHHGRFRELDERNIIFIVAPGEVDKEKTLDILTGAKYSHSVTVVLTELDCGPYQKLADVVIRMPKVENEYLTPFLYIFPLWFYGFIRCERMGALVGERRYGLWARDINFKLHYNEAGDPLPGD